MVEYLKNIAKEIHNVARREDDTLRRLSNEGIFHMPELAFAYDCGKAIMNNIDGVFGVRRPNWIREIDLDNGGPTDLLFKFDDGSRIAIEFKMRDTSHAYIKDLEKLSRLTDVKTARIFCALVDVFDIDLPDDGRINAVESFDKMLVTSLNEPKPHFSTKENRYTKPISCVVGVWSVGDAPEI